MATTTQSVLNRAAALLNDEEHVRWPEAELLEWLNDGQRALARATTDAYVVRGNISAVAGTVQSLPSDGIRLIRVVQNVSSGNAIYQADEMIVQVYDLNFRSATTGEAEVFFYDERNPLEFELYPPQAGAESIEVLYNAVPPNATMSGNVQVNDSYVDALIDYLAYRALSKDTEDATGELGRASAFYRAFLISSGQKDAADILIEPRRS